MSSIEPWLFNNLSLKYLATVKTVNVLYRRSGALHGLEESVNNILIERDISKYSQTELVHPMLKRFDSYLDKLMLPTTIKDDLSLCFWQMIQSVLDTSQFRSILEGKLPVLNTPDQISRRVVGYLNLIDWDAIGRINRQILIECCTRGRETISYNEWAALCNYCDENYIRKSADTVDWKECIFQTPHTIYWYYTIYGTFPTENMFNLSGSFISFQIFQRHRDLGLYEKDIINRTLFADSVMSGRLEAVKFFFARLTDSQKVEIISSELEVLLKCALTDIVVYLLGQIKFNSLSVEPTPLRHLLCWPYVLFIDSWIDGFKNGDMDQFVAIFAGLMEKRRGEQAGGIEKFTSRQISNYMYVKYSVPCERLWTLCCNNFSLGDQREFKIVSMILNSEDIILCKIVMNGSTSIWRQACLNYIQDCGSGSEFMSNEEFCDKFMKQILMNDEKRELFQEVRRQIFK